MVSDHQLMALPPVTPRTWEKPRSKATRGLRKSRGNHGDQTLDHIDGTDSRSSSKCSTETLELDGEPVNA